MNSQNINILRKLNFETFPVKYSTSFYIKVVMEYTGLSRYAFYNDIVIGAYTVRIEDFKEKPHAYILTFGVLEPYRKYNVGRQMMENLEKEVVEKHPEVEAIYLHMHVINEGGKKFYERCGFVVEEKLENYYTDLEEPHCYIIRKKIGKFK